MLGETGVSAAVAEHRSGSAAALANAVLGLLGDKTARDQLADSARTWSLTHDADWTAAKLTALYSEL